MSTVAAAHRPVQGSFLQSLSIQGRIIGALLMRELITRYSRHNIGFLWLFVEPMMFTVGILTLWTLRGAHEGHLPLVPFVLTGYSSILLWRNTIGRCGNALEPNRTLLHHRNVRVIDFFLARIILEISGTTVSFIFLTSLMVLVGLSKVPYNLFEVVVAWILMAWFAAAAALLLGAAGTLSEIVDRVWHVASYLFLPLSGAFWAVDWLPYHMQKLALYIPTVSGAELFREGYFGPALHCHYNVPYLIFVNLVLSVSGMYLIKVASTRVDG
jgi:capsular polysaccharide transport system permease protein